MLVRSAVKLRRHIVAAAALPLSIAVGCASGTGPEGESPTETTTDEALDALVAVSCTESQARRIDVALAVERSTCSSVSGERGTWIARPLFPDAPEDVRSQSCRFTWQSSGSARPDRAALEGNIEGVFSPTCARGRTPNLVPVDDSDEPVDIGPMGGSIGCDVCGKNRDRRGWVVVPPNERGGRLRVRVSLAHADGTASRDARFQVELPKHASAVAVTFPKPAAGQHYVTDSIRVGGL